MGAEELARWADVVPHIGQAVPEALELLHEHGIGLGERFFTPDFPDGVLVDATADDTLILLVIDVSRHAIAVRALDPFTLAPIS